MLISAERKPRNIMAKHGMEKMILQKKGGLRKMNRFLLSEL